MPETSPDQETPENPTFVVGFADTAEGRYGIEQAAADQLRINLRIESLDYFTATKPVPGAGRHSAPRYTLAVDPWLIGTVIEEMPGYSPAPFIIQLRYPPSPGQDGAAVLSHLEHPDAPAYSLSGTVVTDALKQAVESAAQDGLNLVPMLSSLHQRFQQGDYGDANPDTVAANQARQAAGSGEVTGIYLTPALPSPSICISRLLPNEKAAILMLGREYKAVNLSPPADPPAG